MVKDTSLMKASKWKQLQIQKYNIKWYYKKNRFALLNRLSIVNQIILKISSKLILDIGTGDGEIPIRLQSSGNIQGLIVGIDISKELIKVALKVAKKMGFTNQIQYLIADLENLPFREGIFDALTCTAVLEHAFDLNCAISEMARVTQKEKYVIITIPNSFYHYIFQILALIGLRYKDLVRISNLKIKNVEKSMFEHNLNCVYQLNFVFPIPKFLRIIEKFLLRFKIFEFHLFLNQLIICKKEY